SSRRPPLAGSLETQSREASSVSVHRCSCGGACNARRGACRSRLPPRPPRYGSRQIPSEGCAAYRTGDSTVATPTRARPTKIKTATSPGVGPPPPAASPASCHVPSSALEEEPRRPSERPPPTAARRPLSQHGPLVSLSVREPRSVALTRQSTSTRRRRRWGVALRACRLLVARFDEPPLVRRRATQAWPSSRRGARREHTAPTSLRIQTVP